MLKSSDHSLSAEIPPGWSPGEFATYKDYMGDNWLPPPERGHNGPPPSDDKASRKAYFVAEIKDWLADRRQRADDYMSPEEIGRTKDRGFLLRRALIDSIAAYYREHSGAPIAPGVLVLDIVFTDNAEGCNWISAERYASLLGCDEKAVRRARALLAKDGLLGRAKHKGLSDRHWAIINRAFAGEDLHPTWWLDATSDPPAPRGNHSGKPRTKPRTSGARSLEADVRSLEEAKPRTSGVRPLDKTPDTSTLNPGHRMSDEFSRQFASDDKTKQREAPAAYATVEEHAREETTVAVGDRVQWTSNGVDQFSGDLPTIKALSPCGRFAFVEGSNCGISIAELSKNAQGKLTKKAERSTAASSEWVPLELHAPLEAARKRWMNDPLGLSGGVNLEAVVTSIGGLAISLLAQGYAEDHIRAAIVEAISEMDVRALDKAADKARASGGGGFVGYLTKVIKSKVMEIDKGARERQAHIAETEAKAATTNAINAKRMDAFDKAVADGHAARAQRPAGGSGTRAAGGISDTDNDGKTIFGTAAKFAQIAFNSITAAHANQVLRTARKHFPDVTTDDVEEAFVEISDTFTERSRKGTKVSIKEILEGAVDAIGKKYAYAAHGTPEKLAGGAPYVGMSNRWIAIAEVKVDAWTKKYSRAVTDTYHLDSLLYDCWISASKVASEAGWNGYGPETQAKAEAAFEELIKTNHLRGVSQEESRAKADAAAAKARIESRDRASTDQLLSELASQHSLPKGRRHPETEESKDTEWEPF